MPQATLNREEFNLKGVKDSIVIVNALGDIPGGRTLDVTDVTEDYLYAGHVIARKQNSDSTGYIYFPAKITSGSFDNLSDGEEAVGILKVTIPTKMPIAAIVTIGQINEAAMPAKLTAELKTALKDIQFV